MAQKMGESILSESKEQNEDGKAAQSGSHMGKSGESIQTYRRERVGGRGQVESVIVTPPSSPSIDALGAALMRSCGNGNGHLGQGMDPSTGEEQEGGLPGFNVEESRISEEEMESILSSAPSSFSSSPPSHPFPSMVDLEALSSNYDNEVGFSRNIVSSAEVASPSRFPYCASTGGPLTPSSHPSILFNALKKSESKRYA